MKNSDFSKARPGDYLWDLLKGEYVEVKSIDGSAYPVNLFNGTSCNCQGYEWHHHALPRYYWQAFEINPPESALMPPKRKEKRWFFIYCNRVTQSVSSEIIRYDYDMSPFYTDYYCCSREMRGHKNSKGPFETEITTQ